MRFQGKITNWKDDKGFGFITPNGGTEQVFVHIKSFLNRKRRPAGNEIVTYELVADQKGRAQAKNVAFVGDRQPGDSSQGSGTVTLALAILFIIFVVVSALMGKLPVVIGWFFIAANMAAFAFYALDKSKARKGHWRIPESTLHMLGLIGGWPGALIAQRLLRHKSKKQSFQVVFWTTVLLNFGAFIWLLTPQGSNTLRIFLN